MPAQRILLFTTLAILVWLPLPLGSNRPWALYVGEILIFANTILCLLAWAAGWVKYRGSKSAMLIAFILWLLWLTWITCQITDIPIDRLAQWAGHKVALQSKLGPLLEVAPVTDAITLDRHVTRVHLLESAAYASLFFSVLLLAAGSRTALLIMAWALLFSGAAQALYGGFMVLSGLEENIYGSKSYYIGSATGTFVNRNHFAGYLEICFAVGVGLTIIYASRRKGKSIWARFISGLKESGTKPFIIRACLALIVVGLILSQSRMGNAAAFGGLVIAGGCLIILHRSANWPRMLLLLLSLLVVDLWMIGDWFGLDRLVQRYENTDLATTERASYYPVLSEMVVAYAPVGSGLGTFEIAYPEFATVEIFGRPRHAHNDYAQFLIESGLPGFMVIAALVFSTLLRAAMVLWRRRDPVYTGVAFAGLMTVFSYMIHSVTDFNLQIPANAASIVAILAMVWSCNVKRQYTRKKDDKLA